MRFLRKTALTATILLGLGLAWTPAQAAQPVRAQFIDFGVQVIDGQIQRPTGTYTANDHRPGFERLNRLKKSFLPALLRTSKHPVFK